MTTLFRDILTIFSKSPQLLEQKPEDLKKILDLPNALSILTCIQPYPWFLEHVDQIIELHEAFNFFSLSNATDILKVIGTHSILLGYLDQIIQLQKGTNFFSMPNAGGILRSIGYPVFFDHIDQVIELHKATNFFSTKCKEPIRESRQSLVIESYR